MDDSRFLVELLLVIALAAVGVAAFERLRLPAVVGFLAMGALVGPGGLALVPDPDRVRALAELGVVFLLFEIGLTLPLDRVRRLWRRALMAGGFQVTVTLLGVAAVATALGVPVAGALVLGALVAMSSTALVMGLLADRGEIDAPQGQLAVGILLFQDLCIVPFLLAVPVLAALGTGSINDVLIGVGRAIGALLLLFVAARLGLPRLLDRAARTGSRELFALLGFLVVLGSAVVAEQLGLTLAVGAFIGGLALSASPYGHQLFAEVVPLRGVLIGLFFTAVGMLLDLGEAARGWSAVTTYVACVVVFKTLVVVIAVWAVLREGARLGIVTGLSLSQTGEFSFVLAAAAGSAGLLEPALAQTFIAGSVVTLAATPFLVQAAPRIAGAVADAVPGREPELDAEGLPPLSGHVVIVGFGIAGRTLARVLRSREIAYLAVEANSRTVQEARARGEKIVYGDATRRPLLERLGVDRARLIVVAISDPIATREVVAVARALAPDVQLVARTRYVLEVDALEAAGASVVVAEEYESTLELLAEVLRHFGLPLGSIARFAAELREEGYELLRAPAAVILDPWLAELLEETATEWVEVPDSFHGEASLAGLDVRARTRVNVLAVERDGVTTSNPPASFVLRPGDRLLALGTPAGVEALNALLSDQTIDGP